MLNVCLVQFKDVEFMLQQPLAVYVNSVINWHWIQLNASKLFQIVESIHQHLINVKFV